MTDIRIETKRLLIRRFQPSDGVDFAEILTDPEEYVQKNGGFQSI